MRCSEPGMTPWFAIHTSRAPGLPRLRDWVVRRCYALTMNGASIRHVLVAIVALAICSPLHIAVYELIDDTIIAPSDPPTLDGLLTYSREALILSPRLLLACCFAFPAVALLSRFFRWWEVHRVVAV